MGISHYTIYTHSVQAQIYLLVGVQLCANLCVCESKNIRRIKSNDANLTIANALQELQRFLAGHAGAENIVQNEGGVTHCDPDRQSNV